jgi:CDP-glucose 4,6-dehydratase
LLRYPDAVRPWQHVLDCLNGYLCLVENLLDGHGLGAWNFGPGSESFVTVGKVVEQAQEYFGASPSWAHVPSDLHEASLLALDSSKAQAKLKWTNVLKYPESIKWTTDWYEALARGDSALDVTVSQIRDFEAKLRA